MFAAIDAPRRPESEAVLCPSTSCEYPVCFEKGTSAPKIAVTKEKKNTQQLCATRRFCYEQNLTLRIFLCDGEHAVRLPAVCVQAASACASFSWPASRQSGFACPQSVASAPGNPNLGLFLLVVLQLALEIAWPAGGLAMSCCNIQCSARGD